MKIKYKSRPAEDMSINKAGNWVVSCVTGKTRIKGDLYKIIKNPKTQQLDSSAVWYISKDGFPCKILAKNVNSFRQATLEEIEQHKNIKNEDKI